MIKETHKSPVKTDEGRILTFNGHTFLVSTTGDLVISPHSMQLNNPIWHHALAEARKYALLFEDIANAEFAYHQHVQGGEFDIDEFQCTVLDIPNYLQFIEGIASRLTDQRLVELSEEAHIVVWAVRSLIAQTTPKAPPLIFGKQGFVYILRSASGYYKIGRTTDPKDRMRTFSIKLPFEVEYELLIQSGDHITLEKQLHAQFAHCRVNGEWFNLSPEDIEALKKEYGDE